MRGPPAELTATRKSAFSFAGDCPGAVWDRPDTIPCQFRFLHLAQFYLLLDILVQFLHQSIAPRCCARYSLFGPRGWVHFLWSLSQTWQTLFVGSTGWSRALSSTQGYYWIRSQTCGVIRSSVICCRRMRFAQECFVDGNGGVADDLEVGSNRDCPKGTRQRWYGARFPTVIFCPNIRSEACDPWTKGWRLRSPRCLEPGRHASPQLSSSFRAENFALAFTNVAATTEGQNSSTVPWPSLPSLDKLATGAITGMISYTSTVQCPQRLS